MSSSTTVPPPASVDSEMNSPVPCMSGHAGRQVAARLSARIEASTSGGSVPGPRHLPQRDVQVVARPHDGLRAPRRATGVDEHEVVARRLAVGRRAARRAGDGRRVVERALEPLGAVGVRDLEEQARPAVVRERRERVGDCRCEVVVEHERDGVGVVEQVCELGADVAVVHVHRDRAELLRRVERLEVLGRVHAHDRDLVVGRHARVAKHARQLRGAGVELAERQPAFAAHHGRAIGPELGDGAPRAREGVVGHAGQRIRTASRGAARAAGSVPLGARPCPGSCRRSRSDWSRRTRRRRTRGPWLRSSCRCRG